MKRAVLVALLAALSMDVRGGAPPDSTPYEVRWSGELKIVMMKGDVRGTIDLKDVARLPHLYAVGALEGLQGEVTIVDGVASIARVQDGKVATSKAAEGKACVLVYAQVERWKDVPVPKTTRSLDELEAFLVEAARREGIDVSRPFPFLVKGTVKEARYHVLRHPGEVKDTADLHDKAKVKYILKDAAAELVGFYSEKHLGVFTCGGNVHVHLRSGDGKLSGHLDDVVLGSDMRLFVPTARPR